MLTLLLNVSGKTTSMVFTSCTVWLAATLLLVKVRAFPTEAFCKEMAENLPPSNWSECYVVIEPSPIKGAYSGGYQTSCMVVSENCFTASAELKDKTLLKLVNPSFSHGYINGYLWVSLTLENISADTAIVWEVFSNISNVYSQYETNIVVQDMEFSYKVECDRVVYSWTLIPGFTYSFETVCNGNKSEYTNLTNGSLSLELIEGQEFCKVLLTGETPGGGSPKYEMDVIISQDTLLQQCIKNEQLLDGQRKSTTIQLAYLLTLSCQCLSKQPVVIYISTAYGSPTGSVCEKDFRLLQYPSILVCINGDGNLVNISSPVDTEIKVVVDVQLMDSTTALIATAELCYRNDCSNGTTITIDAYGVTTEPSTSSANEVTPNPTVNQTGSTAVPGPTKNTPVDENNRIYWIVGGVCAGVIFGVIITIAFCVYCKWCKQRKRDGYSLPETMNPVLGAGKSSTQTTTGSEPGIVMRLDNDPPGVSPDEDRNEPTLTHVSSPNPLFSGGFPQDVQSGSGKPVATPLEEQETSTMVSSKGIVKKSPSGNLQTVLGAYPKVFPVKTCRTVNNPPRTLPNQPSASFMNGANGDGKDGVTSAPNEQDTAF